MRSLVLASGILAFAAGPALAQSNAAQPGNTAAAQMGSNPTSHGSASQSSSTLRQTLRHDLRKAGFTDVRVMPEAFAVHAKNSAGQPVFMLISPDSLTEVTPLETANHAAGDQSKSGGGNSTQ